jgi:hypothetical protein
VKAVRFMMGSNSQLKYGARLINSYLGDNSTISCCEVLNSLIFPGHEQHHNNSFLCAAVVMGQSNMAAGATIGSNHNSRSADGEIIAGRGFWPGLCVSLKHNSKFASFTLIAKGDFQDELNIPIPFSLISNDISNDRLVVMPGYWFRYNMYALARNAAKYVSRDKRIDKTLEIEYEFLAPDSVNEMFDGMRIMEECTAKADAKQNLKKISPANLRRQGAIILEKKPSEAARLEIVAEGFENCPRKTVLIKVPEAYAVFKELITYYGTIELIRAIERRKIKSWPGLSQIISSKAERTEWKNIGGQLMPSASVKQLIRSINSGKIQSWDEVHDFYKKKSTQYPEDKFRHAIASLTEILGISPSKFTKRLFFQLLDQALGTKEWMVENIYESRAKDYENPFRKMVFDNQKEMEKVTGKLSENEFILQQQQELKSFRQKIGDLKEKFK